MDENIEMDEAVESQDESEETYEEPKEKEYYFKADSQGSSNKEFYEKEIKNATEQKTIVIGFNSVLTNLKNGNLKSIFCASNTPSVMYDELKHYADLNKVELHKMQINNEQLGILAKKQYLISTVGIKKE